MRIQQKTTTSVDHGSEHDHIAERHLQEWLSSSVNPEIIARNVRSIHDSREVDRVLSRNTKSRWKHSDGLVPCWEVTGLDPLGWERTLEGVQIKPDVPLVDEKGKGQKYLGASGYGAAPLFLDNGVIDYWQSVQQDKSIPILITEGAKKAGAGLSASYATISLPGVSTCRKSGELHPWLKVFAKLGRTFYLCFDNDVVEKLAVQRALWDLGRELAACGAKVRIVNLPPGNLKGMDDFIAANGKEEFDRLINEAETIEKWRKSVEVQFQGYSKTSEDGAAKKQKIPPSDIIGAEIAEEYIDKLAFDNETKAWMRYEADHFGVWSPESDEFIESIVSQIVDGKGLTGYGANSFVTNVVKKMRHRLIVRTWDEKSPSELLPFQNGVLDIATGELLPHSPGYRLTWQLPREYASTGKTSYPAIDKFLDHLSNGNPKVKNLLMCYCNAVLKGRADLQRFLHLIGIGGSGKGTFLRLIVSLIGEKNVCFTTLDDWTTNNFEGANAYRKRLVAFADEDKATSKLGKFLSLTGQDVNRAEVKGKTTFNYRFDGMVLVASNLPVFYGDAAARVKRRVITIPCNSVVPVRDRRNLEKDFESELPDFTRVVLAISDDEVTRVLSGQEEIPESSLEFWLNRCRVDSIAHWLNENIIYDPTEKTAIGNDKNNKTTLFGSYVEHCLNAGDAPKSSKTFSPDLLELCQSVLGWEVAKQTTKTTKNIRGLRLRVAGQDDHISTVDASLFAKVAGDGGSGGGSGGGSQSLQDKTFDKGGGLLPILDEIKKEEKEEKQKNYIPIEQEKESINPPSLAEPLQNRNPNPPPLAATSPATSEKEVKTIIDELVEVKYQPSVLDDSKTEQSSLEFDPIANAELLRELLQVDDSGLLLSDLMQVWTKEQKTAVKKHLQQSEIEAARSSVANFKKATTTTTTTTTKLKIGEAKRHLQVGDRVRWIGDIYDGAAGAAEGQVIGDYLDVNSNDVDVKWTKSDRTSFNRRDELVNLQKL